MINGTISTFSSPAPHIYETIYHDQVHMVCMSHNSFGTLEHVQNMINFWVETSFFTNRLLLQMFQQSILKAAFFKLCSRFNDPVCPYILSLSQKLSDMFQFLSPFIHWFWLRIGPFTRLRLLTHGGCNRGCLLLLGIWSHLWYIQRSMFAVHSFL